MKNIWSLTVQSYINSFFAIRRGLSSCILPHFLLHGTEFRVVFSSAEWFGTEFREFESIFGSRNGIPSCFLFRGRVWNRIPRVCFFCSMERNSELFPLPRKGSERNSENFLFRGTAGIPSEFPLCSVYSVFRGIIFFVGNSQPQVVAPSHFPLTGKIICAVMVTANCIHEVLYTVS